MITKKDYEAISQVINEVWVKQEDSDALREAVEALVKYFKNDNPRFDAVRFRSACFKYEWEGGKK